MDKARRNALRNVVTRCRQLLEQAVGEVLQGQYGVHPDGAVEDAESLTHLSDEAQRYREQTVAHLEHIKAAGFKARDAVAQLTREAAFTHLNRLCAYKMMEARGLIREAVSRGLKSQGFLFYLAEHPDDEALWSGGEQDRAYRHFLDWLGGTLSEAIGVLFSPHDPANRLFPPQRVLQQVLDLINGEELADIWTEDEAIGWIYQYFTPKELRERARKESQSPRNAYELAFRNQFFTPRYVVEFLVDNTLGQLWYGMREGHTQLKERCRYLIYPPDEASHAPQPVETLQAKSKKDPRALRILDPACGSGHFLLYCFDLLEVIYREAYEDSELGPPLQRDFPTLDDLQRELPGLILHHNLYGIDIDLRATQIASLALWLRAQRSYRNMEIPTENRRPIRRTNVVCAEPMPGEDDLLAEFSGELKPKVLGQLVQSAFEEMKLAAEAGALLKVEVALRETIKRAKQAWLDRPKSEQLALFADAKTKQAEQLSMFDFSGLTDEAFWEEAEGRVLEALQAYAERAANGKGFRRRLFADDAAQGFAFVDACRQRYDVVLMNPPFGDASKPSKAYITKAYPKTKNDVYAAFVERGLEWLEPGGRLGAITSRTGFFLSSFQKWREEILLQETTPTAFADLGYGVLDTAMVETAAYCLAKGRSRAG